MCIGVKTAVLQLYGWNMAERVLEPFDVSDNLTIQMKLPKEGANKCWNTLEYQLNSITWHMRNGALKAGLTNTDIRMTLFNSLQFPDKHLHKMNLTLCAIKRCYPTFKMMN